MTMLETQYFPNENVQLINQGFHVAFLVWLVYNVLYLGVKLQPEKLNTWASKTHSKVFETHGIAVNFVLFFCTGDSWFKWIGGIVLVTSLFWFAVELKTQMKKGFFIYENIRTLVLLDCHHLGPIVAFYYQPPEHAWLNALFFGWVWWIHGKGAFYNPYLKTHVEKIVKFCLDLEMEDRESEHAYSVVTVLLLSVYLSYLPIGWNYSTAALFVQFFGRTIINKNWLNVDWMRTIELPGVIAVVMWQYGPVPVILFYLSYKLLVHYKTRDDGKLKTPEKFVMSDEIKEWMAEFERKEQDVAENDGKGSWFDGMGEEWNKYVFFKHCMLGNEDEVRRLLAEGTSPNMVHSLWHKSIPMAWAAASGQIGVMCILIEAGAAPFNPEIRKAAKMFDQKKAAQFCDELVPLAYKALRAELGITHERVEAPGLTHKASVELAKQKGGRLCTNDEMREYLMDSSLYTGKGDGAQWAATTNDGKPDWIYVGTAYHKTGISHIDEFGEPTWGDNVDDTTHGKVTWNRVIVYKVEKSEDDKIELEE